MSQRQEILDEYGDIQILSPDGRENTLPLYYVRKVVPGEYGKLQQLLEDDLLEEVMYNGPNGPVKVYHRRHGMCDTNIELTEDEIIQVLAKIARSLHKTIDDARPMLDGRLPDGSRVNATIPPVSLDGPTLTVRKFLKDPLTIVDLIRNETIPLSLAAELWTYVEGLRRRPAAIVISGGTGSGKTTLLNVLAMFVPRRERVITIEDTAELQLFHDHWIRLEARPPSPDLSEITLDMLLRNSLRMRPTRIIVGEVRGAEARTLFTAMNTGHEGTLGTVHANTAMETLSRFMSPPMEVPPSMLGALNLIIMIQRISVGEKAEVRRVVEVSEVTGVEKNVPLLNTIYRLDAADQTLKPTGVPSKMRERLSKTAGLSLSEIGAEIKRRQSVLEQMVRSGASDPRKISSVLQQYYREKYK